MALPLTATPKGGKKLAFIYLCRRAKVKITDIACLSLPRIRTDQSQQRQKGVNKIDMYLCKSRNAKTIVISYLSVLEYGMTNGSNLRDAFTPDSTPKRGNNGDINFVLRKSPDAKTGVTSHLSVDEYGTTNASNFQVWHYLWQRPQKGVTQLTFIYLIAPMVNPMPYRNLEFLEYGMPIASNFRCGFAHNSKPKSGMKKG